MSFPLPPPQQPPPPGPYRASTKSRIIVWSIAVGLLAALFIPLGYAVFGVLRDRARDDKVLGVCHQEARTRIGKGAGEANFRRERVAQPEADRAEAFGVVELRGARRDYTCVAYLAGGQWTVREFRFGE